MRVEVISSSDNGKRVCAAAARISTQEGTASSLFARSEGGEKDTRLIRKVLSSGHKSLLEHHVLTVAFSDVPVTVEQFLIEHRLASFTVKSRRYVDYADAGYHVPALSPEKEKAYRAHMDSLFARYAALTEAGVPKEDARFVLPYCFFSNFFVTANAREWLHIVCDMLYGRGRLLGELREAGNPVKAWLDDAYPGALEDEMAHYPPNVRPVSPSARSVGQAHAVRGGAQVLATSAYRPDADFRCLVRDARPRELELMQYVFRATGVSLAAVTHFARHRMQSPIFPDVASVLEDNAHIVPESIAGNAKAMEIYDGAFCENEEAARAFLPENCLRFFAMAGNACDFPFAMNARELLHFMKLRACNRAQWEIRGIAKEMLEKLRDADEELFGEYGPSCYVDGACPEGRLSCGKPYERRN